MQINIMILYKSKFVGIESLLVRYMVTKMDL